ncbi:hypothetical protein HK104_001270 [Borealophlyctis nickersoniae]|nr:hypothetical protein HK104_001270 [Borealophlyctis nickersoniae]
MLSVGREPSFRWDHSPTHTPSSRFDIDQTSESDFDASYHRADYCPPDMGRDRDWWDDDSDVPITTSSTNPLLDRPGLNRFSKTDFRSSMFSAERHKMRVAEEKTCNVWGAEALQFENIVMENKDDAMVEARTLLRQWVDNAEAKGVSSANDASHRIRADLGLESHLEPEETASRAASTRHIKDLLSDVVGRGGVGLSTIKDVPTRDPRVAMEARQKLVRERRELLEKERRKELEKRLKDKQQRLATDRHKTEDERDRLQRETMEKWKIDVAISSARTEVVNELEQKKAAALEKRNQALSALRSAAAQEEPKPQPPPPNEENQPQSTESAETAARMQACTAKADEMCKLRTLRFMKRHMTEWKKLAMHTRQQLQSFQVLNLCMLPFDKPSANPTLPHPKQVIHAWRALNMSWISWQRNWQKRVAKRHAEQVALALKQDQEKYLKAIRFHRATTVSKVFLAWMGWTRVEGE